MIIFIKKLDNIIFVVPFYTKIYFEFVFGTYFQQFD